MFFNLYWDKQYLFKKNNRRWLNKENWDEYAFICIGSNYRNRRCHTNGLHQPSRLCGTYIVTILTIRWIRIAITRSRTTTRAKRIQSTVDEHWLASLYLSPSSCFASSTVAQAVKGLRWKQTYQVISARPLSFLRLPTPKVSQMTNPIKEQRFPLTIERMARTQFLCC